MGWRGGGRRETKEGGWWRIHLWKETELRKRGGFRFRFLARSKRMKRRIMRRRKKASFYPLTHKHTHTHLHILVVDT